jgi:hypothetical protein
LTLASLRAQLASIAWPRYELRLIDAQRRQCLANRYWTATQLLAPETVGFLRGHNREGCDVYFRPYAASQNAICCWTSIVARVRWQPCERPATRLVWLSKPALAINRLGCA